MRILKTYNPYIYLMKLRISNQSLRIRINQEGLALLATSGKLEEQFGNDTIGTFGYALVSNEAEDIQIKVESRNITVYLPHEYVTEWNDTDRVTFEGTVSGLRVLLEKDFQCLTARPHEDEAKNFRNPKKQH